MKFKTNSMACKLSVLTLGALVLVGCKTTEGYRQVLNTWVGSHIDSFVSSWGPPTASYHIARNNRALTILGRVH